MTHSLSSNDRTIDQNEANDDVEIGLRSNNLEEYLVEVDEFKICQVITVILNLDLR